MRVLLLAGTRDARQIGAGLSQIPRLTAIASIARPQRRPVSLGIPTQIGGFGGDDAFADWAQKERITAIVDATHPFAARISARSHRVAEELGIDFIQFLRPSWLPDEGDDWTFLNHESEAAQHISPEATVFLSTGQRGLSEFDGLQKNRVFVRLNGRALGDFPFKRGTYVYGIPPFSVNAECETLSRLNVDWLVARNSGASSSRSKLEAARLLGIKVAMIRRPPQPPGPRVDTVAEVLAWVRRRM